MGNDWEDWSSQPEEESNHHHPRRTVWRRRKRRDDAEFSAEAGAFPSYTGYLPDAHKRHEAHVYQETTRRSSSTASSTVGWVGLIFAIASWFLWPVIMGPTAAALGLYAFSTGSRALGIWAMTLGIIAAAVYLVLIPIYMAAR
ncbi:hypothetical protein DFQ01_12736 [Paenibacillus cellulosilyticus]|uniref:DUF4190 domain-containing protein n=1 Tax=Paenibacillus cellulosilyticus TaxID=375489 RepID=A0A2V2YNE8_9BACL|nr:hypothetical protein [Paenibacillus cellulosilyticus]PWV95432.1 hypothetical protein DFQ01_12736 [Paenibacillus cellulosilyticus]QKS43190.1 hypothetical protein HUB94_01555 [Paenibacillus cellulosilyticus]